MIPIGSVFLVSVAYEDEPETSKERPAVVVQQDEDGQTVYALPITSSGPKDTPSSYDPYKIPLFLWRSAGLDKPSWAKSNQVVSFETRYLVRYIGQLHRNDLRRIMEALQ